MSVAGSSFLLPSATAASVSLSLHHGQLFSDLIRSLDISGQYRDFSATSHFLRLSEHFSPSRAESDALSAAADYQFDDALLNRDRDLLRLHGSLDAVIDHHITLHKASGFNPDRVTAFLSDDPQFSLLLEISSTGGVVDVDSSFVVSRRTAPLRQLHRRLLPVYRVHARKMCDAHRALLFRVSDLPPDTLAQLHTANDCHWTPKPLNPLGRFLVDCSNASPDILPLNGGTAKAQGIARYQTVSLPTLSSVISAWDVYRRSLSVEWSALILFKEDVAGAFNQLHWSPSSAKMLCAMVDEDVLFMMLTGGFGHCVTPMIWSVVGDAISRLASKSAFCPLHTFVDDTFGAGLPHHVQATRLAVQSATRNVLGPTAVADDKSLMGPSLEILGFLIDMSTGSLRPKDLALDKIFFCFFSALTWLSPSLSTLGNA